MKNSIQIFLMMCAITLIVSCTSITDRICKYCNDQTAVYDEPNELPEYEESEFMLLNISGANLTKEVLTELYDHSPEREELVGKLYNGRFSKHTKDLVYFTMMDGYLYLNVIEQDNEKYLKGYKLEVPGNEVVSLFWKDLTIDTEFSDMFHSLIVITKDSYANSYHTSILSKECGNRYCYFYPIYQIYGQELDELHGLKTYEKFQDKFKSLKAKLINNNV